MVLDIFLHSNGNPSCVGIDLLHNLPHQIDHLGHQIAKVDFSDHSIFEGVAVCVHLLHGLCFLHCLCHQQCCQ